MMAKYQKPCCLLTYTDKDGIEAFEGSMRGYTKTGVEDFKAVLEQCPGVDYVEGHANAAGLRLRANSIDIFLSTIDNLLKDIPIDPIYRVDYDFKETDDNNQIILDIANMNDFWGQDIDRAFVNINFKITDSNFQIMKSNTLKFILPHGLTIIKFNGTEDEIEQFITDGYLEVNAICKCIVNNWGGYVYPQLIMEDYEIVDSAKYFF